MLSAREPRANEPCRMGKLERLPQLTTEGRTRALRTSPTPSSLFTWPEFAPLPPALDDHLHDPCLSQLHRMAIRNNRITKRAGPTCAPGAPTWWNNDQGATPCDVYQNVLDKCSFTAPAIANNDAYYPVLSAQNCMCNTVAYNLGSACQDCQRGTSDQGILFSLYTVGGDPCPSTTTALPESVSVDNIPLWAFIDTSTQFWSYSEAQQIALSQSSSTAVSSQPAPTSTEAGNTMSETSVTPTQVITSAAPSTTAAPVQSAHKSTNAGAIGGGVAGGVVLILAIIGLLLCWRRRRARQSRDGAGMAMGGIGEDGSRNPSASSESSLTESAKAAGSGSHYTPHSQMTQLNQHGGSSIIIPSYSTASVLSTPIDAPPMPILPREPVSPTARSLATSPISDAHSTPVQNKVKRVPVRYSEDELAQAEQEARRVGQE